MSTVIQSIQVRDARYPLPPGEGADAIHSEPIYSYAATCLQTNNGLTATGLAFTLGPGNDLVCQAIEHLSKPLIGREIEDLMRDFGATLRALADDEHYRWLGPHKGVVHLAVASIVNACFDLWAKSRDVPLWKLLLDLTPQQIVATLDLSYLEDVLTEADALALLTQHAPTRVTRMNVIEKGYPSYDTSVGWFHYDDQKIKDNAKRSLDAGFTAVKLKVGSADTARDLHRANIVRQAVGDTVDVMVDANQQWTLPVAVRTCLKLAEINPYWIEEPTHPDDILGHQTLARAITPIRIAAGEHIPNRVIFKNYLQAGAMAFCQVDATRVAGVSEFITVSLLARKFGVPVVPHVGDMGQLHQHLVLFNHVAMNHERLFLEYIPHLQEHFQHPAQVKGGHYQIPQQPGASCDLN